MSYFSFMVPDTWNGFRDIDEKLNFEELNKYLLEENQEEEEEAREEPLVNNLVDGRNIESQQTQLTNK